MSNKLKCKSHQVKAVYQIDEKDIKKFIPSYDKRLLTKK